MAAPAPEGLRYVPDAITEEEEAALLARLRDLAFDPVVMRGQVARRATRHYGFTYGYESWRLSHAEDVPVWLEGLRRQAAHLVGRVPRDFDEVLVTSYPAGAGIGWHRDAPMFGPQVVGFSLGAACRFRFQRRPHDTFELTLDPRSAYVLEGPARTVWQHSIPGTKQQRYSVTFRSVRDPQRWSAG